MKKIIPYLLIPLLLTLLILLIIDNKEEINPKVITIDTNHSYLYNKSNTTIDISLYINDIENPIIALDAIASSVIRDANNKKLINLDIKEVLYSHNEVYLKENYYMFILRYEIPNLNNNFYIDEAYLDLTLSNNTSYTFKIGSFNIIYLNSGLELNWLTIDSKKDNTNDLSINKIVIETESSIGEILEVYIESEPLNYSYINNTLIISLDNSDLYTNNIPVVITTSDKTYYLNNHQYVKDYDLIEKAKNSFNIYELN